MRKLFISFVIILLAGNTSFAQKSIVNDANAELRTINGSFNAIKISGGIDLYLSQYESESVAVSATSEKFKENLKTVVENNVLNIYYDGGNTWSKGNKKLKVYVSFKTLERLEATGACDIQVAGNITGSSLTIKMTGASDFKGAVKLDMLAIDLTGASDVKISGTATTLSIESTGASDVKGFELVTDVCTAKASGASDINVTVNKELNAHASGASDIFYKGTAVMKEVHSSGASSVSKKG
ncbi:MAG: head GIN domain-containing protein [Ferruginibacter sp.]